MQYAKTLSYSENSLLRKDQAIMAGPTRVQQSLLLCSPQSLTRRRKEPWLPPVQHEGGESGEGLSGYEHHPSPQMYPVMLQYNTD